MSEVPTRKQVSAGGVVFRRQGKITEVALISVGEQERWQLPKGLVGKNEDLQTAALREVFEETGLKVESLGPIGPVEYWFYSTSRGRRVRFHKTVHFFLMRFLAGDVRDHDQEVNLAAWYEIGEAIQKLTFASEKEIVEQAQVMIQEL
jgi:8-oxo-dGTP diphosphatase